jgi:Zn-dependent M16 (insulinase) family peptidase
MIREKGGAYGSNARVRNGGTICLSSYLDPNSVETFKVFESSIQNLLSKDSLDDGKMLEAKIKQFGEVDRIKVPQNEGVNQLIRKYTEE